MIDVEKLTPSEAEAWQQLENTIEGIILEAEICTELEAQWRTYDPYPIQENHQGA